MREFFGPSEIAEKLGCDIRRVHRLVRMGQIPSVRTGRLIRIPVAAWEQFVAEQTQAALAAVKIGRSQNDAD